MSLSRAAGLPAVQCSRLSDRPRKLANGVAVILWFSYLAPEDEMDCIKLSLKKTIRSRSNKNIGDVIEEEWKITGKAVIAEPYPGDRYRGVPPRLGIYDYEVRPIAPQVPTSLTGGKCRQNEPNVGGTRREASSVPLTVRRRS